MIRILQVVTKMDRAGIETMLMNYYRNIDRNRFQFDFLCNNSKGGEYDEEISSLGGRIFHTPGLNPFKYPLYVEFMKDFIRNHPEYRIIHAHNDAFAAYSLLASKIAGVPVRIAHVHNAAFPLSYKVPLYHLCRNILPFCATNFWACGKKAAEFYYGSSSEVHIHNNAIDIAKFIFNEQSRESIREALGISESTKVFGHVGRFMPQKNHSFLLDVFYQIKQMEPDSILVLLGDGPLLKSMQKKAYKLGLENSVKFMGSVSNAPDYYQAFDFYIMPSIHEGLPVSAIEAETADLPCLFSDAITDEVKILSSVEFLGLDKSPSEWAEVSLNMLKEHRCRRNMSQLIADAGFDIQIEARKLCEIYSEMLNGSR